MQRKVITIDPRKLRLLAVNAHYMRHETFARLTENVKADGGLTSVPFGAILGYYTDADAIPYLEDGVTPVYEVLSGNHRIKAAIAAGVTEVEIMVTDEPLSTDKRKAIQLSHNAIFGEDDPSMLKMLYQGIDNIEMRLYAGLDDKLLLLMDKVSPGALSEANLVFQPISFLFLPDELAKVEQVWDLAVKEIRGSKRVWVASMKQYDQAMDALEDAGRSLGVKNVATALLCVLEIFTRHIADLRENYLDENGEANKENTTWVNISTILGEPNLPPKTLALLNKAIAKTQAGSLKRNLSTQQALAIVLESYLDNLNAGV